MHHSEPRILNVLLSIFFCLNLTGSAFAQSVSEDSSRDACKKHIKADFEKFDSEEDARVKLIDPDQGDIRPGNSTTILEGDPSQIVFLLHGFLGSPFEVMHLGKALHQMGYTVIMPLIAGFGRSTAAANFTRKEDWLSLVTLELKSITQCQAHVQVLGFSLGALLETKVLLENVEIRNHVESLTLLSPALFIQKTSMIRFGESILRRVKPTPRVSFIAALAHKSSNFDLDIPVANPEYYNTQFPIAASDELQSLSQTVDYTLFQNLKFPVKVMYSESDRTVDSPAAIAAIQPYKSDLQTFSISFDQGVPHQIMMTSDDKIFQTILRETLIDFR